MKNSTRDATYATLARIAGLALVVLCVLFQRRGLLDWSELAFLGTCIGLQETFLRMHTLRRLRTPMLVLYSMLPLLLVLYHGVEIKSHAGDFVKIVLYTPLPLVLVSVQIMVLYVRESSRLISVVLVLALFSTVIGVRRPLDDAVWPWLAAIGAAGSLFLMLQYPGMLYHGVYVARRRGTLPPAGRPGGIMRGAFFGVLPLLTSSVLLLSLFLYFALPRYEPEEQPPGPIGTGPEQPGGRQSPGGPLGGPREPTGGPRDPAAPASVSGLSSGVDLGDFGEIKRSQTPALDLRQLEAGGDALQRVYLRAFTYSSFDGMRWAPLGAGATTTFEVQDGANRTLPGAPRPRGRDWKTRRFVVTLREAGLGSGGQLPLATEPSMISTYSGALYYDTVSNTVRAPSIRAAESYEVTAIQLQSTPARLKALFAGRGPSPTPRPEYLQIPNGLKEQIRRRFGFYPRFAEMVRAARPGENAGNLGVYAAATDIVAMFREARLEGTQTPAWTYSLDFRPEPGPDALARFLDTTTNQSERFGHCEYFASAMCILLRCYGVPARVAAGFLADKPNEEGVFEVTASAAHAWVEAYIEGFGWIAFDPTPSEGGSDDSGAQVDEPPVQPDTPDAVQDDGPEGESAEAPPPTDWLRRYDGKAQKQVYSQLEQIVSDASGRVDEFLDRLTSWLPDTLFPQSGILRTLLLVLPPAMLAAWLLWRRRRRKLIEAKVLRQMGEGGRKRERGLYLQLLLLLARYGFQKRASETPREFARRVLRRGGSRHEPVLELTELYYALRFGLDADLEADFRRALAQYSDALRAASAEKSPPPASA